MTPYQRLEWLDDIARNKFPAGVYKVAIYIGEQARDGRLVEPMATVASKIGISYNSVDRALAILVANGYLTRLVPARQHKGAIFGITNRNDNSFRVTKDRDSRKFESPQSFRSESPFRAFSVPTHGEQHGVIHGVSGCGEPPVAPLDHQSQVCRVLGEFGLPNETDEALEWIALLKSYGFQSAEQIQVISKTITRARKLKYIVRYARHTESLVMEIADRIQNRRLEKNNIRTPEIPAQSKEEGNIRRLRGELNYLEKIVIKRGGAHVGPRGEWISGPIIGEVAS